MQHFRQNLCYGKFTNQVELVLNINGSNSSYEFEEFSEFSKDDNAKHDVWFENVSFEEWINLKRRYNPSSYLISKGKNKNIEMFIKPWVKIYEILEIFPLISNYDKGVFNTLHLEEEVGGMVCGLNHYMKSKCREVSDLFYMREKSIQI